MDLAVRNKLQMILLIFENSESFLNPLVPKLWKNVVKM